MWFRMLRSVIPAGDLTNYKAVSESIDEFDEVIAQAPFILGQGMLTNGNEVTGALIRGDIT